MDSMIRDATFGMMSLIIDWVGGRFDDDGILDNDNRDDQDWRSYIWAVKIDIMNLIFFLLPSLYMYVCIFEYVKIC